VSLPDPGPDQDPDQPQGTIRSTGPGPLVVAGVIGLVVGWAVRPLSLQLGYAEPTVSFTAIGGLVFVAAIIGGTAYATRRTVRRNRFDLAHHQAVNRLVLGKACALVGALVLGGYLGYALAQLGVGDPASDLRLWRSLLAALAALAVTVAALLLELACRVPDHDT
jgi:uncharacterized protein DUF3180